MNKAYRHGEILLLKVKSIPKGLEKSNKKTLAIGSHGNSHSFNNGELYLSKEENVIGYLKAKNTNLLHPEHGDGKGVLKKGKIEDGIYKLITQVEFTPDGFKPVID